MSSGSFITFEGPDGSGKTTQIRRLTAWLESRGVQPVLLRQPGGTELGESIRALLLNSASRNIDAATEMALMFADRAQSLHEVIRPALAAGRVVLCDRYTDSTVAYQGAGRALGVERVLAMHDAVLNGFQPELTVLLLPTLEAALGRARRRNQRNAERAGGTDENRFETEGDGFYRRVHAAYVELAAREPQRIFTVAGDLPIEEVELLIREALLRRWKGRDGLPQL